MVRRTKHDALATREALLDAAEAVFRRKGAARTTLADVAAQAGVTRGAVYWHFRDKGELFGAMCNRATLPLEAGLERAAAAVTGEALGTLRDVSIASLVEIATNPRTRAVLEILLHKTERVGDLAACAPAQTQAGDRCTGAVERIIRRAVVQESLPSDTDVTLSALALHAYMSGIIELWLARPEAFDLAAAAPALIETMVAGLRSTPLRLSVPAFAGPGAAAA